MRWGFSGGQIQLNRVIDSHLNQKIMFINCIIKCGACYCESVYNFFPTLFWEQYDVRSLFVFHFK